MTILKRYLRVILFVGRLRTMVEGEVFGVEAKSNGDDVAVDDDDRIA